MCHKIFWITVLIFFCNTGYSFTADNTRSIISPFVMYDIIPQFSLEDEYCIDQPNIDLPNISDNGIEGVWTLNGIVVNQIRTNNVSTNTYVFTPTDTSIEPFEIEVEIAPSITPEFEIQTVYCVDDDSIELPTLSDNDIDGSWSQDFIDTSTAGVFVYTFTSTYECVEPYEIEVTIEASDVPIFNDLNNSYCIGQDSNDLPNTSDNGIQGSWQPEEIDTSTIGTTTYIFSSQQDCTANYVFDVTVDALLEPTFDIPTTFCINDLPYDLPTTSNNGLAGVWSQPSINTNTVGPATYTFEPFDECGATYEMEVIIVEFISPAFDLNTTYCLNQNPINLPTVSINGIEGTWSTNLIDTSQIGNTTYIFTPTNNDCAEEYSITISIIETQSPTFNINSEYCQFETPDNLPTQSTNGITGIWTNSEINTAVLGETTYTFNSSQDCIEPYELTVQVTPQEQPTFNLTNVLCLVEIPSELPTTSLEGYTGTWSPSISEASETGSYIFTFTSDEDCIADYVYNLEVVNAISPNFQIEDIYCLNEETEELPLISLNNIEGTWSPSSINSSTLGLSTYTFTPNDECAEVYELEVEIVDHQTPVFNHNTTYCKDQVIGALPTTSSNGIAGTWSPESIDTSIVGESVYTFTPNADCGESIDISINIIENILPEFNLNSTYCVGQIPDDLPTISNNGIAGVWSSSEIDTTILGTTSYVFTPSQQCATPYTLDVIVTLQTNPIFSELPILYCVNSDVDSLPTVSDNGIVGVWSSNEVDTSTVGTYEYIFVPDDECNSSLIVSIEVVDSIQPEFTIASVYCYDTGTYDLPVMSDNDITGTWSSDIISTDTIGTFDFTFTPDSDCAEPVTISIQVKENVIPVFDLPNFYCFRDSANPLPIESLNGIMGSWEPAIVNTQSIGDTTYVFTPDDECGMEVEVVIRVRPTAIPEFDINTIYCQGATPQELLPISDNGLEGIWLPETIDTSMMGTATYTFIPTYRCAQTLNIEITIEELFIPEFSFTSEYCLNQPSEDLPSVSDNGVSGVWNVTGIDTTTIGQTIYTFTPDTSESCAESIDISINITDSIIPEFSFITEYCQNQTPQALPSVSDNGVSGTWNVSSIDTTTIGQTIYTFTPNASESCAETIDVMVNITDSIIPEFSFTTEYCQNQTLQALPSVSDNGISGTWNVSSIDTTTIGQTIYTFTPDASESCAETIDVMVNITDSIIPEFSFTTEYCLNQTPEALPSVSDNGVSGTWNVTDIDTTTIGQTIYTFTPNASESCAETIDVMVNITDSIIPEFSFTTEYCQNQTPEALPSVSDNGISGVWNSALIDTSLIGQATHIFIPDDEYCAEEISVEVYVNVCTNPNTPQSLTIYNVITPNGDGINDYFTIPEFSELNNASFSIYDRYGTLIYKADSPNQVFWNGKTQSVFSPSSDYWYMLKHEGKLIAKGHITVKTK